jgi:hypothetical protein
MVTLSTVTLDTLDTTICATPSDATDWRPAHPITEEQRQWLRATGLLSGFSGDNGLP